MNPAALSAASRAPDFIAKLPHNERGFLNRFNDTIATELEKSPIEAGKRFLAEKGWTVGKHAG